MHSQGKSRTHNPPPARSHLSVSTKGIGIPFLLSEPPTPRETHSWDTHPHGRDPRDKTWIREMTPLLNLRYLVDDLEHSKDTTKGQMRHAHTPTQSTRCSPLSVGSMERTVHKAHAMKAKQHLLHQKTSDFSDAPTHRTEDQMSGPEAAPNHYCHPPPIGFLTLPSKQGEKQARDHMDRPRKVDTITKDTQLSSSTA